jgi:hypothetical protein
VARFSHLTPGEHRFKLAKKRAGPAFSINLNQGGKAAAAKDADWRRVDVADRQTQGIRLTQRGTGTVTGVVRENGEPLRRARVRFVKGDGRGEVSAEEASTAQLESMTERMQGMFGGASTGGQTNGDGVYRLPDIPVGEHRLRVSHAKRAMPQVVTIHVREGDNTLNIDLSVSVVSGRVIGPAGPVARAKISVALADSPPQLAQAMEMAGAMFGMSATTSGVRSDEDGRFEVRGVRAGAEIVIQVVASGFSTAVSEKLTVRAGETRDGIELRLQAAGKIAVRITGEAPAMAALQAEYLGSTGAAATVAPIMQVISGRRATLKGLRPGKWRVKVSGLGAGKDLQKTVEVTAMKTTRVVFER